MSFRSTTFFAVFFFFLSFFLLPSLKKFSGCLLFRSISILISRLPHNKASQKTISKAWEFLFIKQKSHPTHFLLLSLFLLEMTINWSLFCGKFYLLSFFSSCVIYQFLRFYLPFLFVGVRSFTDTYIDDIPVVA